MKLNVKIRRIVEESCEIEVADYNEAKTVIQSLHRDDFSQDDEHYHLEVWDENNKDVIYKIQPFTPNLN